MARSFSFQAMQLIDRFSYCEGTALFWSEYHSGQNSRGYSIMSRILAKYSPGPGGMQWENMDEDARDVYRAWCKKEGQKCDYDTVKWALENSQDFDLDDDCISYFVERYGDELIEETSLVNYEQSDFVNLDMCYIRDLLEFYQRNEDSVLHWADQYCDACGYSSRLHLLEGQTIETPDDFAIGLVNAAMTYLGGQLLQTIQNV